MKNKIVPNPAIKRSPSQQLSLLVEQVRELIYTARKSAVIAVNSLQVITSYKIGKMIVEHEQQGAQRAEYGKLILKTLSDRLTAEFGGGFSKRNLEYMRRFFMEYHDRSALIAQMPSAQLAAALPLSWSQITHLNVQKKRHEQSVIIAYANYDSAVTEKTIKEQAKTAANAALRQQSETVLQNYGERINALLSTFQADFRIICSGVTFRGGPPSGELVVEILGTRISSAPEDAQDPTIPSLANTLSAGDRSALGLAFFLAVIEHDSNLGNMIVVFDDSFHSQDRSRRRRTIEAIHRVANHSKQCFVLSHDLDFAREAARVAGVAVNTFKIDPMADHSILQAGELPPLPTRSYEKDYAKLTGYLRDPAAYSTQLKDIARCLRQTLEGYLHSKFPEAWAETDWLGVMIDKIRAAQLCDLLHMAIHLEADLTAVNEYSKRFYHHDQSGSDATDVDPRELKGYVEQTLKIISK